MRGLKGGDRLLSRNRWKRVKKPIEAMSSFEIVEEVPQRYTCANEYGSPANISGSLWTTEVLLLMKASMPQTLAQC